MILDIQVMKTERTPEKKFSVELPGDRDKGMAAFDKLAIELYIWASEQGLFEETVTV